MSIVFTNFTTGKGLYDEIQNDRQMRQFTPMYSTNYCFSVAFHSDKLEYDNIVQV